MSEKVLKIAGRRPMLLALIIMATIVTGLLFSGWLTPAPGRAQPGQPNPTPGVENINCDNPTTTTTCAGPAQLVLNNVVIYPAAATNAPFDSIVCMGDTISASLLWSTLPSTNQSITCHTCDGSKPTNWCDDPVFSTGDSPCKITNEWQNSYEDDLWWVGFRSTNGIGNSMNFCCLTSAVIGYVSFDNLSAQMPTNPAGCGVWVHWGNDGYSSRSYAMVEVGNLAPNFSFGSGCAEDISPTDNPGTMWVLSINSCQPDVTNFMVTASPNPDLLFLGLERFLPAGWQMSGGLTVTNTDTNDVLISRTKRLVDITHYGTQTIIASSGLSHKTNTFIITAPIKLNIQGYNDTNKYDPGAILFVNADDDNTNGIPDMDETNAAVVGEDDLVPLTFTKASAPLGDTVTLVGSPSGAQIRIWTSPLRGPNPPVIDTANGPYSYSFSDTNMPTLYIEGVSASAYTNDVTLTVSSRYTPCCYDQARITVGSAQLAVDMNRDGQVNFDSSDATAITNPYCFWLNNNHDGPGSMWNAWLHWLTVYEDLGGSDDLSSTTISCTRDLEDYTRLAIQIQGPIQQQLTNGDIVVKLESDGPQIRVYQQAGSGLDYLHVSDTAQQQISAPYKTSLGTIGDPLPAWLWTNSTTTANLLFDGIGAGNDKVKVVLYTKGGARIGEGQPVYLKLQDVKNMYETWTVGDSDGGTPSSSASQLYQCTAGSPAANQYILFVHGWNMSSDDKDYFANTAFKRLWWQGFKGRFGSFRWPTRTGFTTFDDSEFVAWQSATGLASKLNDLNSQYPGQVYLFAHSMGNVVAGEALKINNGAAGNGVAAYVACQAAIAAHAYDPTTVQWTPHIGTFNTPDSLAAYPTSSDPCYFNGVTSAGSEANFFNQNDWALRWWVRNQRRKPFILSSYSYSNGDYWQSNTKLTFPGDRYTIFAYCVQNRSLALGATASVGPFTPTDITVLWGGQTADIYGDNFQDHPWHSGEFLFSTVEQWSWWNALMGNFFIQQ